MFSQPTHQKRRILSKSVLARSWTHKLSSAVSISAIKFRAVLRWVDGHCPMFRDILVSLPSRSATLKSLKKNATFSDAKSFSENDFVARSACCQPFSFNFLIINYQSLKFPLDTFPPFWRNFLPCKHLESVNKINLFPLQSTIINSRQSQTTHYD